MMKNDNRSEETLFQAAINLPEGQARTAFLDQACAGDDALRKRLETLLEAHERNTSVVDVSVLLPNQEGLRLNFPTKEYPGQVIGRYKLLQKIGEGGMGVVYMAEQEEPVRRRVALKIIKLGMDTWQVVARFEAERQALALMDHPNIARVFDGGATEAGRPYFVMELVQGVPITTYCDKNKLPARDRLKIFIQVCQAIQSAHQKAIIHRDLKPSNVLVTLHHGEPMVKVIDFGVAKATNQKLTEKTLFTNHAAMIGTPAYMSPEQAEMSSLDVDTRTDIYALGVILYELLAGSLPFPEQRLRSLGYGEIRRVIMEEEPERPSTRLGTLTLEQKSVVARNRGEGLATLCKLLQGDLDWVAMKCLEKDRRRRYETALDLAADLKRHLENEPVTARPPSAAYRLGKAFRRNKLFFTAGAAVMAALVLGIAFSSWQAARANKEARRANAAVQAAMKIAKEANASAEEANAVSLFMADVFRSADPDYTNSNRNITVIQCLAIATNKLETDFHAAPFAKARLESTLGKTYFGLGLYHEAVSLFEKSLAFCRTAYGPEGTNTLVNMNHLGLAYSKTDRIKEAIKINEEVLGATRKVFGSESQQTLNVLNNLSLFYRQSGRPVEAIKMMEEVLALRRKVNGPEDFYTIHALHNLASLCLEADRKEEAIKMQEEVLKLRRKVNGPEHPDTIKGMGMLAVSYRKAGKLEEAKKLLEETLTLFLKAVGPDHPATWTALEQLASTCDDLGRHEDALRLRKELVSRGKNSKVRHLMDYDSHVNYLSYAKLASGSHEDALAILREVCEQDPKATSLFRPAMGAIRLWLGQEAEYETIRTQAIRLAGLSDDAYACDRAAKLFCIHASSDTNLLAKALQLAYRAVDVAKTDVNLPGFKFGAGLAEYRNGHYAQAEKALLEAETACGERKSGFRIVRASAQLFRAMTLVALNRQEEGQLCFGKAQSGMPPLPADLMKPAVGGKPADTDLLFYWLALKEAKAMLDKGGFKR
jgi:tetratricopeptide (TPR) repeat protein